MQRLKCSDLFWKLIYKHDQVMDIREVMLFKNLLYIILIFFIVCPSCHSVVQYPVHY